MTESQTPIHKRDFTLGVAAPLIGGAVLLVVAGVACLLTSQPFLPSYLIALFYWLGIPLGALGWWMIWRLTGGNWGRLIAKPLAMSVRSLPLFALLFVPIAAGATLFYPWAMGVGGEHASAHHMHGFNATYLTPGWFVGRAVVYFALWLALAWAVTTHKSSLLPHRNAFSAVGLVLYVFTMSFAAVDWAMSLDPEWLSTIYGLLFVVGQAMASLAVVLMIVTWPYMRSGEQHESKAMSTHDRDALHDLGKLLHTCVSLWAYMMFCQLLIYWAGNVPAEITWYADRLEGGWGGVFVLLVIAHFIVPFVLLLSRDVKRSPRMLFGISAALLVFHLIDLTWRLGPSFEGRAGWAAVLDVLITLAIGGLWCGGAMWLWRRMPVIAEAEQSDATQGHPTSEKGGAA